MSIPNFNGKSNQLKCQVWLMLAHCRYSGYWFTSEEIAEIMGVNIKSLRAALTKWCSPTWKRILRRQSKDPNCIYEYRISAKGYEWVYRYQAFIPDQYYTRVMEWKRKYLK